MPVTIPLFPPPCVQLWADTDAQQFGAAPVPADQHVVPEGPAGQEYQDGAPTAGRGHKQGGQPFRGRVRHTVVSERRPRHTDVHHHTACICNIPPQRILLT